MKNNKTEENKDKIFVFNIGQLVKIKDLNLKGRVSGIYVGPQRTTYDIRYFWDGTAKEMFFRHEELVAIQEEEMEERKGF